MKAFRELGLLPSSCVLGLTPEQNYHPQLGHKPIAWVMEEQVDHQAPDTSTQGLLGPWDCCGLCFWPGVGPSLSQRLALLCEDSMPWS